MKKYILPLLLLLTAQLNAQVKTPPRPVGNVDGSKVLNALEIRGNDSYKSSFFLEQEELSVLLDNAGVQLKRDPLTAQVYSIRGSISKKGALGSQVAPLDDPVALAYSYVETFSKILGISAPKDELKLKWTDKSQLGEVTVALQQVWKGYPVHGAELRCNITNTTAYSLMGRMVATSDATVEINVNQQQAIHLAQEHSSKLAQHVLQPINSEVLAKLGMQNNVTELVWVAEHGYYGHLTLCYQVSVYPNFLEGFEVYIDAATGNVKDVISISCTADGPRQTQGTDLNGNQVTLQTYQLGSSLYLLDASRPMFRASQSSLPSSPAGAIVTYSANNTSLDRLFYVTTSAGSSFNKSNAVSAHQNAEIAYEYFRTTHGRNSIDGVGGTITSIVDVADDKGQPMDNAYWNGKVMAYGNGGTSFRSLAGSLDVGAHEMSHGVIGATANLVYKNMSGALNESFADVFGVLVDRDDWLLGEDIVTSTFPSGALRSMKDPNNGTSRGGRGWQPAHMREYVQTEQDNGGVHINSGIPNHAFYLLATATSKAIAEKIYYRALTRYLTPQSQFLDCRQAVIQAAEDIHGATSAEVTAVREAFDGVGILDPNDKQPGPTAKEKGKFELPVNPGEGYMIYYSLVGFYDWYIKKNTSSTSTPIADGSPISRGSVQDDGSYFVYVDDDNYIMVIDLDKGTTSRLSNEAIFRSVALSKDGGKLAAVTFSEPDKILVYDFGKQQWYEYELYNPTTDGGKNYGDISADAIEFDHTGQYIMYDAYNEQGGSGAKLDYWDIGYLHVWDNRSNSPAEGEIDKLFSQLPEGISVGNPTFSKNSPYLIALEAIDVNTSTYSLLEVDLVTSEQYLIFRNSQLNYPSFDHTDRYISFNARSTSGDDVIAIQELGQDKVTPVGSPSVYINDAVQGLFYADGQRRLRDNRNELISFGLVVDNEIYPGEIVGNNVTVDLPNSVDVNALPAVFEVAFSASVYVNNGLQQSGVTEQNFSSSTTYTVQAQDLTTKNYLVTVTVKDTIGIRLTDGARQPYLEAYPVPSQGLVQLRCNTSIDGVELYSVTGKVNDASYSLSRSFTGSVQLDISSLPAGMYVLRALKNTTYIGSTRVVKL